MGDVIEHGHRNFQILQQFGESGKIESFAAQIDDRPDVGRNEIGKAGGNRRQNLSDMIQQLVRQPDQPNRFRIAQIAHVQIPDPH